MKDLNTLKAIFREREETFSNLTEAIWLYIADVVLIAFADIVERDIQDIDWSAITVQEGLLLITAKVPFTRDQLINSQAVEYFLPNFDPDSITESLATVVFQLGIPMWLAVTDPERVKDFFKKTANGEEMEVPVDVLTPSSDFDYSKLTAEQTNSLIQLSFTTGALKNEH